MTITIQNVMTPDPIQAMTKGEGALNGRAPRRGVPAPCGLTTAGPVDACSPAFCFSRFDFAELPVAADCLAYSSGRMTCHSSCPVTRGTMGAAQLGQGISRPTNFRSRIRIGARHLGQAGNGIEPTRSTKFRQIENQHGQGNDQHNDESKQY